MLDVLGRGGMGIVYRARDEGLGRDVALKVLAPSSFDDLSALDRFRREATAAAAVSHPNVAVVHASGEIGGHHFLAVELLTGGSLADRLARGGPLPWQEVAEIGAAVASGLAAIHAAGIVHRDLKPANVLIDDQGRPKLTDFGLAADRVDRAGCLTKTGELLGTLEYVAPEQAESAKGVDARADVYSLGATLHALLTGRPPFEGSGIELLKRHLLDAPRRPSELAPSVPPELDRLVLKLLSKAPAARGDASAAARALGEIAAKKGSPPAKRGRGAALGAFAAGGLAIAAAVAFGARSRDVPPTPSVSSARSPVPRPSSSPTPASSPEEWSETVLANDTPARSLAVSPDGKQLLVGREDGTLALWTLDRRAFERGLAPKEPRAAIVAVAFDPAHSRVLSASSDGSVVLTDLASGDEVGATTLTASGSPVPASSLCFSNDGQAGILGDEAGQDWAWELGEAPPQRPQIHRSYGCVTSLAVSPDGKWLASGHRDGSRIRLTSIDMGVLAAGDDASDKRADGRWCRVAFVSADEVVCARGSVLEHLRVPKLTRVGAYPASAEIVALDVREDRVLTAAVDGAIEVRAAKGLNVVVTARVADARGKPIAACLRGADSFVVATERGRILLHERAPAWYRKLPAKERPALPLPQGLAFGPGANEYVHLKSESILLFVGGGGCAVSRQDGAKPTTRTVSSFFIGKCEVSKRDFEKFVAETRYETTAERTGEGGSFYDDGLHPPVYLPDSPLSWRAPYATEAANAEEMGAGSDRPVEQVSWDDAVAYGRWADLRLPREVEWEKAALWDPEAGRERRYPWGDEEGRLLERANLADESYRGFGNNRARPADECYSHDDGFVRAAPVTSFRLGASAYGALNMYGNASEWCEDEKPGAPESHLIRGASWSSYRTESSVRFREFQPRTFALYSLGFRVARSYP